MSNLDQAKAASNIDTWVSYFKTADIPVLKQTARAIAQLRQNEDNASARDITIAVINDPLMVFKILHYAQNHKGRHQLHDLAQVEQAVIMMGTYTFFNKIPATLLVEDMLQHDFHSLKFLLKRVVRSHRASRYAAEFAAHLMDLQAEEIRVAAMLHDISELLLWCFDPDKMKRIVELQAADKTLRSQSAQEEVLGFKIIDLQHEIVKVFALPALLTQLMDDNAGHQQRVRNVRIAVNLARHSANGWDDAALPDDYKEAADLLHVDIERVKHIIGVPGCIE